MCMAKPNVMAASCLSGRVIVASLCALLRAEEATHRLPLRRTSCPRNQALTITRHGPKSWPMPPRSKRIWTTSPRKSWGRNASPSPRRRRNPRRQSINAVQWMLLLLSMSGRVCPHSWMASAIQDSTSSSSLASLRSAGWHVPC